MKKQYKTSTEPKKIKRAKTQEDREEQMIALATNLAEQQILDGTASSQVITHFLRLGSSKERLENQLREKEKELMDAKTEAIKSSKRTEELYEKAMRAFTDYKGVSEDGDEDDELYY